MGLRLGQPSSLPFGPSSFPDPQALSRRCWTPLSSSTDCGFGLRFTPDPEEERVFPPQLSQWEGGGPRRGGQPSPLTIHPSVHWSVCPPNTSRPSSLGNPVMVYI